MKFIKLPDVLEMTGKGRTATYKEISEGTFPKPVPQGGRAVAWVESEIIAWMESRIAERDRAYQ